MKLLIKSEVDWIKSKNLNSFAHNCGRTPVEFIESGPVFRASLDYIHLESARRSTLSGATIVPSILQCRSMHMTIDTFYCRLVNVADRTIILSEEA